MFSQKPKTGKIEGFVSDSHNPATDVTGIMQLQYSRNHAKVFLYISDIILVSDIPLSNAFSF